MRIVALVYFSERLAPRDISPSEILYNIPQVKRNVNFVDSCCVVCFLDWRLKSSEDKSDIRCFVFEFSECVIASIVSREWTNLSMRNSATISVSVMIFFTLSHQPVIHLSIRNAVITSSSHSTISISHDIFYPQSSVNNQLVTNHHSIECTIHLLALTQDLNIIFTLLNNTHHPRTHQVSNDFFIST